MVGCSGYYIERSVGERIKHRRMSVGMTQQELSEHVGISCLQLSRYEKGIARPSAIRLLSIAKALNLESHALSRPYETMTQRLGAGLRAVQRRAVS